MNTKMLKYKSFYIYTLLLLLLTVVLYITKAQAASSLANHLQGYILLQVESVGEAWYVIPKDQTRVYMPNGSSAYQIMRYLSLGITNADLSKIPVGIEPRFNDQDQDQDGLSDNLEKGLGTDPNKADTDNDSFSDGEELKNNFNPLGASKLTYNTTLVNRLKGYILLQVEKQGQAWYLNPKDGKRYYMQDGDAAYQIMRFLSLGITNQNLNNISISKKTFTVDTTPPISTPNPTPTPTPTPNPTPTPPGGGGGGGGGGGNPPATPDYDNDNDGYDSTDHGGTDCNDNNANIRPNATEICDSIDNDCDNQVDEGNVCTVTPPDHDSDNDGYNSIANSGDDCNDSNASIHPGATEICGDGIDQDCLGGDLVCPISCDFDQDGYINVGNGCGGNDCNDANATLHPGATEICSDGVDQDCNNLDLVCSTCSQGAITSRCLCGSTPRTSGYCCSNTYQTNSCPVSDTTPPSIPTNLSATVSGTQVSLTWTASTDNTAVTGYNILRSTTNGTGYQPLATSNTNSYINTGLTAGTTYYYVVRAYDAVPNTSANSNQAIAVIASAPPVLPSSVNIDSLSASVLTNDQSYTINGSGFGTKATPAPFRWDDFDNGTLGARLPVQSSGGWTTGATQAGKEPRYSNTHVRLPGTLSAYQNFTGGNYSSNISLQGVFDGEAYLSGWFYRTASGANSRNFKWIQFRQGDLDEYSWEFRQDAYPSTNSGHIYVANSCPGGAPCSLCDDEIGIPGYTSANCNMYYGMNGDLRTGSWHRYEIWLTQGILGQNNGHVRLWLDGQPWMSMNGVFDPSSCRFHNMWLAFYFATDTGSPQPQMETWWDELYVDLTPARVEIGNNSVYNNATHREIQIPHTTWDDSTIQFTANKGTFGNEQLYLFVVDRNGNASSGYPVTFN